MLGTVMSDRVVSWLTHNQGCILGPICYRIHCVEILIRTEEFLKTNISLYLGTGFFFNSIR